MSHGPQDAIAIATQVQAAPAPAYHNSTVTVRTQGELAWLAAYFRAEDGHLAHSVDSLILHVPFLILHVPFLMPRSYQLLLQLIRRLTHLTRLRIFHSELLLSRLPVLGDHIVNRTSLTELKLDHAGTISYRFVARLRSRLVSIHVHGFPGTSSLWIFTAALLQSSAATLQEINMPNVVLDLRARTIRFPQARTVHITYDCLAVFDLGAYKFAFPNLRHFRLSVTPAPSRLLADQEMFRRRNLLAGLSERGWEDLNRVYAPPHALWLLGLLTPVDMLSLPIGLGGAADQRLFDVLAALNPTHLQLQFQNTEDARAVVRDFGTLLEPLRVPRLHTLMLDCYLPLVQLFLKQLLADLVCNLAALHCEELTVRFFEHVPAAHQRPAPMRPTYVTNVKWDALTLILLGTCARVKRVVVMVSTMHGSPPMAVYTANALPPQPQLADA